MNKTGLTKLRVSLGLVISDDKVLFIRRCDPEIPEYDTKRELPGGKIERGEDAAEAARREVLEETGYLVTPRERISYVYTSRFPQKEPPIAVNVECWLCTLDAGERRGAPRDAEQVGEWLNIQNLPWSTIIPGSREFALWAAWRFSKEFPKDASLYEVVLESVDTKTRRKRYYALLLKYNPEHTVSPFAVHLVWGGIHGNKTLQIQQHVGMDEALSELRERLTKRKLHGYSVTKMQAMHPLRSWIESSGIPFEEPLYPSLMDEGLPIRPA